MCRGLKYIDLSAMQCARIARYTCSQVSPLWSARLLGSAVVICPVSICSVSSYPTVPEFFFGGMPWSNFRHC